MNLKETKEEIFSEISQGEEINIDDIYEALKSCCVSNAAIKITKDILALIDLTKIDTPYASLLIFSNGLPAFSKKTTTELIKIYRLEDNNSHEIKKGVLEKIYGRKLCCVPEIELDALLIPLDGPSGKHPDYINFSMLNGMESYSDGQTLLSFSNYLDLVIPKRYQSNYRKFAFAFECHSVYFHHNGLLHRDNHGFGYLKDWQGVLHKEMKSIRTNVVSKLTVDEFKQIKEIVRTELNFPVIKEYWEEFEGESKFSL